MEEGFPDGRALREIRQEVDNETIARLEPRQLGTGAVYEEVDMNGETEMPKVRKAYYGYPHGIPEASGGTDQVHYHTEKKVDRVEIMFENFDVFCVDKILT